MPDGDDRSRTSGDDSTSSSGDDGPSASGDDGSSPSGDDGSSGNGDVGSVPDPGVVADRIQAHHSEFLDAVAAAGRVTATSWEGDHAPSRGALLERFEAVLRETGTLAAAPAVLATAVDAAGGSLQAEPVPSPPYVAVTSRGLVLRATTDVGRVVVAISPFAVERDPVQYVHRDADATELLEVTIHD